MGISDHMTCLLRNLYAGQEVTVVTGHGTTDWFKIMKGVHQGCILSPCFLISMKSASWEMLGSMKHKLESRLQWEISVTSDVQMAPPLWQKAKKNWRASWWKWKKSAWSQCEELCPWQRSWGRRLDIHKGVIKPQETPCSRASTPQTRVYLLYCFILSPTPLTLQGADPHYLSLRRS